MSKQIKTGGRKIGTPNKTTKQVREKINLFIDVNFDRFLKDYEQLETKDRVLLYEKMLKYILPQKLENELIIDLDNLTDENIEKITDLLISKISL